MAAVPADTASAAGGIPAASAGRTVLVLAVVRNLPAVGMGLGIRRSNLRCRRLGCSRRAEQGRHRSGREEGIEGTVAVRLEGRRI